MKKKYIILGITCGFIFISGIFYSCAYKDRKASAVLVTSLSGAEEITEEQSGNNQNFIELNSGNVNLLGLDSKKDVSEVSTTMTETKSRNKLYLYVHICGAVVNPGVFQVESGARLFDLIELSGGLSKEAAGDYINQAQTVTDGQRVYIPTKQEVNELSAKEYMVGNQNNVDTSNTTSFVNINTANAEELMDLPGIGQAKANSIISYRTTKGKFKSIEDLMNIPGIKEGLFNQISANIIVK